MQIVGTGIALQRIAPVPDVVTRDDAVVGASFFGELQETTAARGKRTHVDNIDEQQRGREGIRRQPRREFVPYPARPWRRISSCETDAGSRSAASSPRTL